jgi:hypothetical protein
VQPLATFVELVHALLMLAWIAGLPLLFWHRWPRLTRGYAVYAVAFVLLSQASHHLLDECFITSLARYLWESGSAAPLDVSEWFTVRVARWVFGMTPSHRAIVIAWEIAIAVTALGALTTLRSAKHRRHIWDRS